MQRELTVIICTHNRANSLLRTLDTLRQCRHPQRDAWEVLVVDNAGEDHTHLVVAHFDPELPVSYAYELQRGKCHALNRALALARSDRLIFLDDDVLPAHELLTTYWRAFEENPDVALFGGPVQVVLPQCCDRDLVALPQTRNVLAQADFGEIERFLVYPEAPIGGNMAVRRSALGGELHFNPVSAYGAARGLALEDGAFTARVMRKGFQVLYLPEARVGHVVRGDQVKLSYFRERYANALIAQEQLDEIGGCAEFLGVPRYHFRRWLRHLGAYARALLGSRRGRLAASLELSASWKAICFYRARGRPLLA